MAALDHLPTLADLARWHAEPDVVPFALELDDGEVVGYGELWEDREEDEAELARLVVDPARRGRGHGRALGSNARNAWGRHRADSCAPRACSTSARDRWCRTRRRARVAGRTRAA